MTRIIPFLLLLLSVSSFGVVVSINNSRAIRRNLNTNPPSDSPQQEDDNEEACILSFDMESVCEQAVTSLADLLNDLGFPDHYIPNDQDELEQPVKQEGDFDVASYMSVLDHLSLPEGTTLDWVYNFDWGGGNPVIYVRSVNDEPFASFEDYQAAMCDKRKCPDYLEEITPMGGYPQGYMQLAVLDVMAEQFYLYWHANYNDYTILYNEATLEATLEDALDEYVTDSEFECGSLTQEEIERVRNLDVTPKVKYNPVENTVETSILVFTKWGGFSRKRLSWALSESKLSYTYDSLVPYQVCYVF